MQNQRKTFLFIATFLAIGAFFLSSCMRDEDKDLFSHPFVISGDVDPNLGIPVANAQLNIEDILNMLQSFSGLVYSDPVTQQLTVFYDTTITTQLEFNSSKHHGRHASSPRHIGPNLRFAHEFSGTKDLDLFQNISALNSSISVHGVIVDLLSHIQIEATDQLESLIEEHNAQGYIDSLYLIAFGANGDSLEIAIEDCHIELNAADTQTVHLLNNYDATELLNMSPRSIKYKAQICIEVPAMELLTLSGIDEFLVDSLTIRSVQLNSTLNARFPMNMCIHDLDYSFATPLEAGSGLDSIFSSLDSNNFNIDLDTATLILKVTNGIPYSIILNCNMLDADSNVLFPLTDASAIIQGSPIAVADFDPSVWVSDGTRNSTINLQLDQEKLNKLKDVRFFEFNAMLNSSECQDNKPVTIRTTDIMNLEVYLKINPHVSFNIPLSNNESK